VGRLFICAKAAARLRLDPVKVDDFGYIAVKHRANTDQDFSVDIFVFPSSAIFATLIFIALE
jgi:hypothetical protein